MGGHDDKVGRASSALRLAAVQLLAKSASSPSPEKILSTDHIGHFLLLTPCVFRPPIYSAVLSVQ
jgi:hypothetical protein